MPAPISGLHHVTAIAGAPRPNVDFYTDLLGLRLVKKTVNYDDPGTYHLYYGDAQGQPGTILTFFPWPDALPGRGGAGTAVAAAFAVPEGALDYWLNRFADRAHDFEAPEDRFGVPVVSFKDPDGLALELVADPALGSPPAGEEGEGDAWSPVPHGPAIRGFHGVTLAVQAVERTARLLTETFGWEAVGEEAGRLRFRTPGGGPAGTVDLLAQPARLAGRPGPGIIHHVAFRARGDDEQRAWAEALASQGYAVTPVADRQYFRSIYFREPGGVLFEIATDSPGFLIDEPLETLGASLRLPPWLEPQRDRIERRLPGLEDPRPRPKVEAP